MAAPIDEEKTKKRETAKLPDELDLTSPKFNATKALFSEYTRLPFASAKPLDNLARYETWCKKEKSTTNENVPSSRNVSTAQVKKRTTNVVKPEHTRESQDLTKYSGGHRNRLNRNVLTRMDGFRNGPMSFLKKCVENRHVVKVWTRSAADVRGFCTGYLVAFDKYFNLAMMDVDETYRKPVSRDNRITQCVQTTHSGPLPVTSDKPPGGSTSACSTGRPTVPVDTTSRPQGSVDSNVNAMQNLKITSELTSIKQAVKSIDKDDTCPSVAPCETRTKGDCDTQHSIDRTVTDTDGDGSGGPCSGHSSDDKHAISTPQTKQCSEGNVKDEPSYDATSIWCGVVSGDKTKASLMLKHRHVNQLFIRGDNVVSVSLVYK